MGVYPDGQVQPLVNVANGGGASVLRYTGINDAANYAVTIQNQNATGLHLNIPGVLAALSSGVTIPTLTATTLNVTAVNATTANVGALNVSGNSALGDAAGDTTTISGNTTVGGTFGVTGVSTLGVLNAGATTVTSLTATGNVALGDANADTLTVIAASTFRNALGTATQLFVDAANNRVIVGAGTALTTAPDDKLSVVGGALHLAGAGAGTPLVQAWRYGAASTVYWGLKVSASANPDLMLHNDADAQVVRFMDSGLVVVGTATAAVGTAGAGDVQLNDLWLTDGANYRRLLANGTSFQISANASSSIHLTIASDGRLTVPLLTVDSGATVSAGGISVTGASTFANSVTVSSGGIGVTGSSTFNSGVSVAGGLAVTTGAVTFPNTSLGFFGGGAATQQAVGGSRGGNVALLSLLNALSAYGLIFDTTTA